jgi:hypothetical protein
MERIKRYNQILLAILGTVGIFIGLALFGLLLMDLFDFSSWRQPRSNPGIIAGDEIEQLRSDSLRRQVISFNQIELIDTAKGIFLVPVEFANLEKKESIEYEYYEGKGSFDLNKSYHKFRQYSNLILYQPTTGLQQEVFDKRVSVGQYKLIELGEKTILLISYADEDTNGDDRLDGTDLQRLAYVVTGQNELQLVNYLPRSSFIRGFLLHDHNQIIIQLGFDKDKDGKFEYGKEPMHFYQLKPGSDNLSPLLSEEKVKQLQQRLDGF